MSSNDLITQEELAEIANTLDEGLIALNAMGVITYINNRALTLLGYQRKEVLNKVAHDLIHYKKINGEKFSFEECLNSNTIFEKHQTLRKEDWYIKKDGSFFPVRITMTPIFHKKIFKKAVIVFEDISDKKELEADLRSSNERLEVIIQQITDGITVQDSSANIVFANDSAAKMSSFNSAKEMLEAPLSSYLKRFEILDSSGKPFQIEDLPGRKALKGEASKNVVIQFIDKSNNEVKWSLVSSIPIFQEINKVQFVINIFKDITSQKRSEDSLVFLAEASRVLASSLDYKTTLNSVAKLAIPKIADWCAVEMMNKSGGVDSVALAHKDPEKIKWAKQFRKENPTDLTRNQGLSKVLKNGKSELYPEITPEMIEQSPNSEQLKKVINKLGLSSVMIVPLTVQKKTIGAIEFVSSESKRRFTKSDLNIAEQLALRASFAIDNSQLYMKVQEERHRLNTVIANVPGIVWESWGEPGTNTFSMDYVSDYAEKMLGYKTEQWIKKL